MKVVFDLLNGILALGILAWPLAFFSSLFFFDAPGSEDNAITIGLAISVVVYPLPTILGNILYWKKRALSSNIEKLIHTLIGATGYLVVVIFMVLLDVICEGRFACV